MNQETKETNSQPSLNFSKLSQDDSFFLTQKTLQLYKEKDIQVLMNLLRLKEPEAYIHSLRVASLMDEAFQSDEEILRGALLHDIGKLSVPFSLSLYPRGLTENERKIMDIHTALGAEILIGYSDTVLNCVKYHHDGTYPVEYVQELRACDIFDALISERPYRPACSMENTMMIMIEMGIDIKYLNAIAKAKGLTPIKN